MILQDLGSSNGTFVKEDRITRVRLKDGDVFRIGATKVRVRIQAPEAALGGHSSPEIPPIQVRETPKPRGGGGASVELKPSGSGRILQYHKIEDKGGFFSEDLSQRGGLFKLLLFIALLILGGLLFVFAFQMGSGGK